jgi:hypothetical protein
VDTAERQQREDNARKARQLADELFPGENWKKLNDGIYLSDRKKIGAKTNFADEKKDAEILQSFGNTVYLVPELRSQKGKKYDAIVDGQRYEFKNVSGNANTLEMQFLRSRSQAPNVFINLDESNLTRSEIMSTLYGARNKPRTEKSPGYADYNQFSGGWIILKIKGQRMLIYLNVDDLKLDRQ